MTKKPLGLVFFPAFDWSISPTHPECEERLLYTRDQIVEEGLLDLPEIREYKPRLASLKDVERVHIGIPDLSSQITDAHLVSAGSVITAAESFIKGETAKAFALSRPPGHHAMRLIHGTRGFCTINVEAIMVEYLRQHYGIKKVAIIDTDVHHGDGTQDIFYHDPDTLFISFHQDGRTLYPGSGFTDEIGGPGALFSTVNLPLPPGTSDEGLHYVLDNLIQPMLHDFNPDIIINSAGQDNHYSDPLANMAITAQGYASMAQKLNADIAVLEGGYSIETALPYVNVGIILAMAGLDYSKVIEPDRFMHDIRQSDNNNVYIKKLVNDWRNIWSSRHKLKSEAIKAAGDYSQRRKNIYYDESGIKERQRESVRLCPKCHGFITFSSESEGYHGYKSAFIAVIPRNACPDCVKAAYDAAWHAKKAAEFQHYFIQDKQQDVLEELT